MWPRKAGRAIRVHRLVLASRSPEHGMSSFGRSRRDVEDFDWPRPMSRRAVAAGVDSSLAMICDVCIFGLRGGMREGSNLPSPQRASDEKACVRASIISAARPARAGDDRASKLCSNGEMGIWPVVNPSGLGVCRVATAGSENRPAGSVSGACCRPLATSAGQWSSLLMLIAALLIDRLLPDAPRRDVVLLARGRLAVSSHQALRPYVCPLFRSTTRCVYWRYY